MAFAEAGCDIPDKPVAVKQACSEYRIAEDWMASFLGECCTPGDPHDEERIVRHADLYRVYQRWAKNNGEYVRSSNAFGKAMQTSGWHGKQKWFDKERGSTVKIWYGFELLDEGRQFTLIQGEKAAK